MEVAELQSPINQKHIESVSRVDSHVNYNIIAHDKNHPEKVKKTFTASDTVALVGLLECDFTKSDESKKDTWQSQLIQIAMKMKLYTGAAITYGNSQRAWANSKMKLFVENLNSNDKYRTSVIGSSFAQQKKVTSQILVEKLELYSKRRGREKKDRKVRSKVNSNKSKIFPEVRDVILKLLLDHCHSHPHSPELPVSIKLFRFLVLYSLYKLEQYMTINHLVKTRKTVENKDEIIGCLSAGWCKDFISDSYQNQSKDIKDLMKKAHVDSLKDKDVFPKLEFLESLLPQGREHDVRENKKVCPTIKLDIHEVIDAFKSHLPGVTTPPVFPSIIDFIDNDENGEQSLSEDDNVRDQFCSTVPISSPQKRTVSASRSQTPSQVTDEENDTSKVGVEQTSGRSDLCFQDRYLPKTDGDQYVILPLLNATSEHISTSPTTTSTIIGNKHKQRVETTNIIVSNETPDNKLNSKNSRNLGTKPEACADLQSRIDLSPIFPTACSSSSACEIPLKKRRIVDENDNIATNTKVDQVDLITPSSLLSGQSDVLVLASIPMEMVLQINKNSQNPFHHLDISGLSLDPKVHSLGCKKQVPLWKCMLEN